MALVGNHPARIMRKMAKRDIHGREIYGPSEPVRVSIVHLRDIVEETSVRADSSASRGASQQGTLQAKLLVAPTLKVSRGDVIEVRGRLVEVESVHDRIDIFGRLNHLEIGGNLKGNI